MTVAAAGVGLMVTNWLPGVLAGMAMMAIGTYLAQAHAAGLVSRAAEGDRAEASGLYLTFYFSGGLTGAVLLGQVYPLHGWHAMLTCVAGVLALSAALARDLDLSKG